MSRVKAIRKEAKEREPLTKNGLEHFYEQHFESALHQAIVGTLPADAVYIDEQTNRIAASFVIGGFASAMRAVDDDPQLGKVLGMLLQAISDNGRKMTHPTSEKGRPQAPLA